MDNSQISSRESLLGYLGGDEKKLEYYLGLLATCKKPFDVADRVIRPIYVNEDIDSKVFTTNAFYGSIACLAPEMRGRKLKPNTLYYHIPAHLSLWNKERNNRPLPILEVCGYPDRTPCGRWHGCIYTYPLRSNSRRDSKLIEILYGVGICQHAAEIG